MISGKQGSEPVFGTYRLNFTLCIALRTISFPEPPSPPCWPGVRWLWERRLISEDRGQEINPLGDKPFGSLNWENHVHLQ